MRLFLHVETSVTFKMLSIWFTTLSSCFSTVQFSNSWTLMPFRASAIFCFTSFTWAGRFPLRTFFIWGNKRKSVRVRLGVGHGGHAIFCSNCWTLSTVWAGVLVNRPSWNGQMCCLQKSSLKPNTASHNNAKWCADADGFLEHSPSGEARIPRGLRSRRLIPGFSPTPLVYYGLLP